MTSSPRESMKRTLVVGGCALCLAVVIACDSDDDKPGNTTTSTSTSNGTGGATGGSGGSTSGTGGSTSGTGGSGGSSTSSTSTGTGGQPDCDTCSEFLADCLSTGCPSKSGLCTQSIQPVSGLIGCICQVCWQSCSLSCTESGEDDPGCVTCLQNEAAGSCTGAVDTCNADS